MSQVFLRIFNMSVCASYLVLAVLLARLVLKRAPKWIRLLLWAVVGLRLVCPFTLESAMSLIPSAQTVPQTIALSPAPAIDTGFAPLNNVVNPALEQFATPQVGASVNPMQIYISLAAWIWAMGVAAMLLYTVISYFRLDLKMDTAVRYWGNVYQSENVASPFVLGLFRPRIYLPFSLDEKTMEHVIAHEQAHIQRRDHWWKPLGFLLLTLHWFNPLMWLSYSLVCRDIELACDEKVIRKLSHRQRADYSQALLVCSLHQRPISACPLAFGEVGVKDRVKSILHYRKPTLWILLVSLAVCAVLALCFLTDPREQAPQPELPSQAPTETATLPAETEQNGEYAQLADLAYYLELAFPDKTFQAMPSAPETAMIAEYRDYLDGYLLLSRESTDGTNAYILGLYVGIELTTDSAEAAGSLYSGLPGYITQLSDGRFLHYPPLETEAAIREMEEFLAAMSASGTIPASLPQGAWITENLLTVVGTGELILIEPPENTCNFGFIAANYLTSSQGRTHIADAAARGVRLFEPETPYLQVYRVDPVYGELIEYIPLPEDLAETILSQPPAILHRGYGFAATLRTDTQEVFYSEISGVPQTVLDMAIAQCRYTFQSPEDITAPIVEARFDCPWLEEPLYAKEQDLPRLEQILKNAAYGYMGACGYGAYLHLTMADGNTLTVVKGTDGCDSIAFGSWGGYFLGVPENTEFWHIFGLSETDHLPLSE